MYGSFYSDNFFLNFITSFIFLSSLFFISFLKIKFNKKEIVLFGNYQPVIIFFLFLSFFTLIFNFIVYFDKIYLFRYITFLYFLLIIFILVKFENSFFSHLNIKFNKKNYKLLLLFLIFLLIAILPISDVDSVSVHLRSATYIYENGLSNIDYNKNFEFLSISNSEILLLLSPILKSDNFGSQLNFFTIFFLYLISKKNFNFFLFLFSCPLFIFLISTQKLQLFFSIIFLILFILIQKDKIKSKSEIFLFISLLSFYATGKVYYVLLSLLLLIYFLLNNKDKLKISIIFSLINLIIIFLPIFLLKYKFFGNPTAPFFDEIFGNSRDIFTNYSLALRESQGWLSDYKNFLIYIKPFLPTNLADLSNTLGLIFFLLLFDLKLQKELNFIPLIIIITILSTGQILSRYYFESFLLLSYFYLEKRNNYIKLIGNLQLIFVICFTLVFIFMAYVDKNVIFEKNKYMNKFSYGFYNNNIYNKYADEKIVLTLTQGRANIFSNKNIIPRSFLEISDTYNGDKEKFIKFLNDNKINFIISYKDKLQPACLNEEKIAVIEEINATRNFLNNLRLESYVYKVDKKNC